MDCVLAANRKRIRVGVAILISLAAMPAVADDWLTEVTRKFNYDDVMQLTSEKASYGFTPVAQILLSSTRYEYDELGRQTIVQQYASSAASTDDYITKYDYDVAGNLSKLIRTGPSGSDFTASEYDYDTVGRQTQVLSPEGGKTLLEYDKGGNLTKQRVLRTGTSDYLDTLTEYDELSRATESTNPEGPVQTTTYNTLSQQIKAIAETSGGAKLSQQRWYYDDAGRVLTAARMADADSTASGVDLTADQVTQQTYDDGGRVLTRKAYNMNASTAIETVNLYEGHGWLSKTTDPAGSYSESLYNDVGEATTRYVYDSIDTRTFENKFDGYGNITKGIALASSSPDDLTTSYAYDALDRQKSVTDPESFGVATDYDQLGRVYEKEESRDLSGLPQTTRSKYDRLGRNIELITWDWFGGTLNQTTSYGYDLAGRRTQITYPDDGDVDFEFDLAGQMTKKTDQRSVALTYDYDGRGLMTRKYESAGDIVEEFEYDDLGRLTVAQKGSDADPDAIAKTTMAYDDLSRVTQYDQELFAEGASNDKEIDCDYDQAGNRLTMLYEPSGDSSLSLAYSYDDLSQNTKVRGQFRNADSRLTSYQDMVMYDYDGRNLSRRQLQTLYKLESEVADGEVFLDYFPEYDQHRFVDTITNRVTFGTTAQDELAPFHYDLDKVANIDERRGIRASGSGFSQIQLTTDFSYDKAHRVTAAFYDYYTGGTKDTDMSYSYLGNRLTTYDHTNSVSKAYVSNGVNEYSSIEDLSGGGPVTVHYDAAGNLSRDELDFEYTYDYDNRLTKVTYEGGTGSTQVAHFEYDALGRMISSQLRFDSDVDGDTETLKYYYDNQEVVAEYDTADNLSRRYIHGTRRVDERAILLEGEGDDLDTYYYLLQDLQSVTGLAQKNGALLEANRYDAYGEVEVFSYHAMDVDRDGTVGVLDVIATVDGKNGADVATDEPLTDHDMDGDTDDDDVTDVSNAVGASSGVAMRTSGLGNPYFFTGRRLHFLEDLSETGENPNLQVQYNRARHYCPMHGRWLQRDPAGYVDGMSLYEYVKSRPSFLFDPTGSFAEQDWIANASPTVEPNGGPFILVSRDVQLPTGSAGWPSLILGVLGATGQLNVTVIWEIDQIWRTTLQPPINFIGKTCYCPWRLAQECKACDASARSAKWVRDRKIGPFAFTKGTIRSPFGNNSYDFECKCSRPQVPPKSVWTCKRRPKAKCCPTG